MLRRSAGQGMPVIAALAAEHLQSPDLKLMTSDFIVAPWHRGELSWRIRRQVTAVAPPDAPGIIGVGDLTIDTNRYDVYLAGKTVVLTFKEYQLLKLLASNPGRAFTRETLLEQVWGYEYFGGTRTVDVHIRRLRSKIEDATHTFVDTVWNVGYRFRG
ncbi:MAG: response regulator transcription factor [SAR202 cluster bacterium]|nr:response regulator transcription factor [SAR202 cluster bacterium]